MYIYHRVDTTCQIQKYVLQLQCLFITELIPRVRHKSTYYNNNVYLSQSWYHVSDTKVRITTTMSIYHRVDTTCQNQKYVLQQQCLFITELIPRVRHKSTYYNNNVYLSQSWYHVSDTKVRVTTTMSIYHRVDTTCQTQMYVLQQQCLFITELIPRVRPKSTHYNNNVFSSQSWCHVSDPKVRITTTMSIYHRVYTTCQIQTYVLQQQCIFITELIPRIRHKSTYYNNNVYLSQSWYHVSDTTGRITTTMSFHHRVDATYQTQKYVLQQQCLFITEFIPRVRPKRTYCNNNIYLSQSWYHVSDPKVRITTTMYIYHRVDTTCQTQTYVLQQCLFITELIPRVRPKRTYCNNNVYLSQSWYHVSDPKGRITTTMSIYHSVNTTCQTQKYVLQQQCLFITELIPRIRHKSTYYNNNVYLSQSWYHVSDTTGRITTTMSFHHRVDATYQTQKYVLQQQCLFITEFIPRVRPKRTYCNNNIYLSQSWYHVSDPKGRITTTMSIYHRVDTTCQTQKYVLQQQCIFITELIPRVRHKRMYYNNNVYLSQSWYHVSDTKVRITTTMSH